MNAQEWQALMRQDNVTIMTGGETFNLDPTEANKRGGAGHREYQ